MRHTFTSQILTTNEGHSLGLKMLGLTDSSMTLQKYAIYIPRKEY